MRINLAHLALATDVLGPGRRAVIWVQGCHRRCRNCITPQMQSFVEREWVEPVELTGRILGLGPIEGITLVGGEPFEQAAGLSELIDALHERADVSVFTYSGYTLEQLCERNDPGWAGLLARTDILVDGEYVEKLACDLIWRGSSNQRLLFLSDRYGALCARVNETGRRLEFTVTLDGDVIIIGIPAPEFYREFWARLRREGLKLTPYAVPRTRPGTGTTHRRASKGDRR